MAYLFLVRPMATITLTAKLKGPDPWNPVSIFHLAQGFYLAGTRCLLPIEVGPGVTQCLVSPGVVNFCLAIELFLKAVITSAGKQPPKTHKLSELFARASAKLRSKVRSDYERAVSDPTFDGLISLVDDYFMRVRYKYEFNIFGFHEHPISVLAQSLYAEVALLLNQKTELEKIRV